MFLLKTLRRPSARNFEASDASALISSSLSGNQEKKSRWMLLVKKPRHFGMEAVNNLKLLDPCWFVSAKPALSPVSAYPTDIWKLVTIPSAPERVGAVACKSDVTRRRGAQFHKWKVTTRFRAGNDNLDDRLLGISESNFQDNDNEIVW